MDKALDQELYKCVKRKADKIYERHGLYKSAWIQKEYKRLGGKYKGSKPGESKGISRWLKGEQWIEVGPYLKNRQIVLCGTSGQKGKACRPLRRATAKTPITIPELLKLHTKKQLQALVRQKEKDMDGRIDWKRCKFHPSSK